MFIGMIVVLLNYYDYYDYYGWSDVFNDNDILTNNNL